MNKQIKERGIIFNGEMVRAILDGRKTQTRRVIKNQPAGDWPDDPIFVEYGDNKFKWKSVNYGESSWFDCPFGKVGDRLYVRETFRVHSRATDVATLAYKASERQSWTQQVARVPIEVCTKQVSPEAWTPSIHMPKAASRITLEITDIRVERLNDISEEDAKAEGAPTECCVIGDKHFLGFRNLWKSIYGKDSWQSNPFVWVVEFNRVEAA
ncbi:hypothetical protein [Rosenbergiella epipactidis]|uniref:hypothetical protein n=1 Tax=Rosenbergiella epipactidis TaxID=1544694 RepID=UPI001F4DFBE6|nr:hypothetical protein [Rosenbergiella epipactidis]